MKRKTIRNHNDFYVPRNGLVARNDFFMVKAKPAKFSDSPRYGIVATKKMFKLATLRNRAKRMLRDWVACNEIFMLDNLDYVVIASDKIQVCLREDGRRYMQNAMKKIARIYKKYEPTLQ
jgi:ribonuclease P protein component